MKIFIALIFILFVSLAIFSSESALGQEEIKGEVHEFRWEFNENACSVLVGKTLLLEVSSFGGKPALLCQQLHQMSLTSGMFDVNAITIPAEVVVRSAAKPEQVVEIIALPLEKNPASPETEESPEPIKNPAPQSPQPAEKDIMEIDLIPTPAQ